MSGTRGKQIMFYVQHLLGVGHVRRAALISDALVAAGHRVHMVLGGADAPGISFAGAEVHRLPEARAADASFSSIVDRNGSRIDDVWRANRRTRLNDLFLTISPDILLIEQFPFGRRQFRFELLPLLDLARENSTPPEIVCSVRDFLVNKHNLARALETAETINRYFDCVLVHGDPSFLPLEASFDETDSIAEKLRYTGYVAPQTAYAQDVGTDEVIVAAGGGAVGGELLKAAIAAKPLCRLHHHRWRFLVGPNFDNAIRAELEANNDDHVVVEANRSDYPSLLSNCVLSVSQAGYNTLMDIVTTRCRAVVVPFSAGAESEQSVRAQRLADDQYLTLLPEETLSPSNLASSIDSAMARNRPEQAPFTLNGATETARMMTNM